MRGARARAKQKSRHLFLYELQALLNLNLIVDRWSGVEGLQEAIEWLKSCMFGTTGPIKEGYVSTLSVHNRGAEDITFEER